MHCWQFISNKKCNILHCMYFTLDGKVGFEPFLGGKTIHVVCLKMVIVGPKTTSTGKRLFRQPDHMVQNQPCWDASYTVEHSKQRNSYQLDFALFWNCHCVTWGLASMPILFHVTGSSKRPLIASCGAIFQKSLQQDNMYGISRLDWRVSKMRNKEKHVKKSAIFENEKLLRNKINWSKTNFKKILVT